MQEIMGVIGLALSIIYIVASWKAWSYLSYYMFHVEATYTNNVAYYYMFKFIKSVAIGFITIPVAVIHKLVTKN